MTATLFVPLNDDLIEQHPELLQGRLVPYRTELPCYRGLAPVRPRPEVELDSPEVRHVAAQ